MTGPYPALPYLRWTVPDLTLSHQTRPNATRPERTSPCRIRKFFLTLPNHSKPDPAEPDASVPYHATPERNLILFNLKLCNHEPPKARAIVTDADCLTG